MKGLNIALSLLFEYIPDLPITKEKLQKLFQFTLAGHHFLFGG